jgi:tetratricopeptide (TPR) repeat protein
MTYPAKTYVSSASPEWRLISGARVTPDSSHEIALVQNGDFKDLFELPQTRSMIGADIYDANDAHQINILKENGYASFVEERIAAKVIEGERAEWLVRLMCIGVGAMRLFLQANVTGPPVLFNPEIAVVPECFSEAARSISKDSQATLMIDGHSAYHLAHYPILLVLAKVVLNSPALCNDQAPQTMPWWRLRVNFLHQRVLPEEAGSLYEYICADMENVEKMLVGRNRSIAAMFLVERAMIDSYFGKDKEALGELERAAEMTGLQYALTGIVGKRTKFQQQDVSQLVVLAKSAKPVDGNDGAKPKALDLNDDTLLESIAFSKSSATIKEDSDLPEALQGLDPGDQPPLDPLDATILLLIAETIKNTNPEDGLTREQMMPFVTRVLSHSTNWEVYTLALLVRSRIEGSRTRNIERSVLQLQVVVDQVIAETAWNQTPENGEGEVVTSFLSQPKQGESAPVRERLLYIHQIPIPTRWELEAELASRWISVGGLRTALDIYERLEMWPEVALCLSATENEPKAREVVQNQLFESGSTKERVPPPSQAPRLWCILGDIDECPDHYEKAWKVSGKHYARAMRSLGRYHIARREYQMAADAYGESLKIFPLHGQGWFALGCCWLELEAWDGAIRAFRRAVNIDNSDAEAWSNLATALLHQPPMLTPDTTETQYRLIDEEEDIETSAVHDPQGNLKAALRALKNASKLKRDSWRIWENYLTVSATLKPPALADMVSAMKMLIVLRKDQCGESAVDVRVLEMLIGHVVIQDNGGDDSEETDHRRRWDGVTKQIVEMVEKEVVPIITSNPRLWRCVGRLELWRRKPVRALEACEKAWRAISSRHGSADSTEASWEELVDATVELADSYQSLGPMERTEGLAAGEMVAKDWRFKARSVVRGTIGKGKDSWEGTKGWDRLVQVLEKL